MSPAKYPSVPKYCGACQRETRHEVRTCGGASVWVCRGCVERALLHLGPMRVKSASRSHSQTAN